MCAKARAAALPLFLLLLITQTSCIYVAYLSDKAGQAVDSVTKINSGTLVAAPGTRLADLRRNSTLDLGEGVKSMVETSKRRTFQQSKRFNWQLPNSQLLFKDCNSYSIYTDETGEVVVDMQVGTAQRYYTWAEVKAEMLDIEQRLIADGWQSADWKGQPSSDRMHKELENPDFFNQFDDGIADAAYEKGDLEFIFTAKRARGEGKPNIAEGQNFLHYVLVKDTAYEARKMQQLEADRQRINEQLQQKEAKQP